MNKEAKIKGGYFIVSRKLFESEIQHKPSCFRETWIWLLGQANHKQKIHSGKIIERGQTVRTISDIQEGLCWYVGYRKEIYSRDQVAKALRYLREASMIDTTKTTRGMIITVCNYDYYQNHKNYEAYNESGMKATRKHQGGDTINKNEKNIYIMFEEIESKFTSIELKNKEAFLDYWTEKNEGGKKERWQMENVFDINKRFRNWLKNKKEWGIKKDSQQQNIPSYHK